MLLLTGAAVVEVPIRWALTGIVVLLFTTHSFARCLFDFLGATITISAKEVEETTSKADKAQAIIDESGYDSVATS